VKYALDVLLVAAALLAATGCGSSEPASGPGPTSSGHRLTLDEDELKKAGDALSAELAKLPDKDPKPTIRIERLQNLTGHRLDMNKLLEEARRRLVESNKYAVSTQPDKHTDFLLVGEVRDEAIKLQVVDAADDTPALTATANY
jgi:hypothetical protein